MTITITKTRLAIAVLAVALIAPATAFATHIFDDVPDNAFYADAVEWAAANGITQGRTPDLFDPNAGVTRGENVTFAYRYDTNIVQPVRAELAGDISTNATGIATNTAAIADTYTQAEVDMQLATKPDAYWAVVESDGTLVRGSMGATATQLFKPGVDGAYEVVFTSDVTGCVLTATIGRTDSADLNPPSGEIGTAYRNGVPNAVFVKTRDSAGSAADRPFHVTVLC